jgi:hypothetical protein
MRPDAIRCRVQLILAILAILAILLARVIL